MLEIQSIAKGVQMKVFGIALFLTMMASATVSAGERDVIDLVARDAVRASNVAHQLAPLKSASDVYQYSRATPKNLSPLSALSDSERERFIQSLRFNEKGLTQFDYTALEQLSSAQVYKILSLFGMQSSAGLIRAGSNAKIDKDVSEPNTMRATDFLMDYRCAERATCSTSYHNACTSNC